ncbi:UDP-glucose--hexose-1-phosphate uridylyltransferase [Isachenkonia alkalipeptolytica]|uniref:Galactose-1-phosphate uridylyltransferase n=1 Tax=Isachenkonia alkalipeptolytica TaxID=2565777 RepID=A0AA44BCP5_9CLOT|nr:UDP-glucose--hexose-1-phosphate uridylyltransferase [Isachenkonia alkalipeptolytica]NBG87133.1 UDP-glucose--hexose-1-phosphate uridylyltransferase [Isachenkonia alkalipeptolytica]
MIEERILDLAEYGRQKRFFPEEDFVFVINRILEVLNMDTIDMEIKNHRIYDQEQDLQEILGEILDWAAKEGLMEEDTPTHRDLLDGKLMGALLPGPSQVITEFEENYQLSPTKATETYYKFSIDANYIRKDRTDKNRHWVTPSDYGDMEITINLSKPEKDPKTIAKEKEYPTSGYPKCLLCRENEGYAGRINHPARQNLRLIPLTLDGEPWFLQYSPYLYYNEHSVIFSEEHRPMVITKETFRRMLHFLEQFPHYFIGSNADLPIVGGSILSHDHYQGGRHAFPMEKARIIKKFMNLTHGEVIASWIQWPLSVIRLHSHNREALVNCANEIFKAWKVYEDKVLDIFSATDSTPHNTITPIARKREGLYELDVVLRNNRTSQSYPEGVFHPHRKVHGVKKENIGLIEVMGLAILPPRLEKEMEYMVKHLEGEKLSSEEEEQIGKHRSLLQNLESHWNKLLKEEAPDRSLLFKSVENAIGKRFIEGLEHAGVFKDTSEGQEGFLRFMTMLGWKERDHQ